jgi:chitin synthase
VSEYVAGLGLSAFCERYVPTMRGSDEQRIVQCARANGWREGVDYVCGHEKIWLAYGAWKAVEDVLRAQEAARGGSAEGAPEEEEYVGDDATDFTHQAYTDGVGLSAPSMGGAGYFGDSADNLLASSHGHGYGNGGLRTPNAPYGGKGFSDADDTGVWDTEYDKKGGSSPEILPYNGNKEGGGGGGGGMIVKEAPNAVEDVPTTKARRWWLRLVWLTTWFIPSYLLRTVGRMKRPDVRLAWREKVTIFWLIFLFNAIVIFYIIEFGRLLCPNFDKVWALNEVNQHTGDSDYWVAVQGEVYDLSNFIHGDHSNGFATIKSNRQDYTEVLAGQDLTYYFPPPLTLACAGLVTDPLLALTRANWTDNAPLAHHSSGSQEVFNSPNMKAEDWYKTTFFPKMKTMHKGHLVYTKKEIAVMAADQNSPKIWAVYNSELYDLTDYVNSQDLANDDTAWQFLDQDIVDLFKRQSGQDISKAMGTVLASLSPDVRAQNLACLENAFLAGWTDFRKTAKCQVQNYLLIIISVILISSIGLKFLAALQLGGKRNPELQDKFVLCQVPCYTEGEDSLRRTIDSLAALNYDDKRKLIFIICDGNIIGSGNDRTTPRIVLDILGVDPGLDPEPLLFKSVGEGSKAINYGKIYSGLYEFEGHVVPYMVVVKVGKPTERSKPGNRGKRDSQILLLHYLNRVHFDSPMSPLELEIYHQMRNVIGIDPAFYEYIFTVDADTTVTPDSLNRLVATTADDSSIIGVCGETKLTNEEGSWWTMIQVYEYYISHHLSKAFESLFGSVTCLPGCFTLYRIRTADKGRPVLISNRIIEEYAEPNVDTLHKKNLFSLGEDRFLTTLLMKHFPTFKTKFCPHAVAHTMAPESWRVLFSQRRRWINSTVHNLCELVILPELFGFCCFSMRFFVFLDLVGTMILPATVVYLVYLIVIVATGKAALPTIALVMLASTYGLQALIFIIKREFMLVGWMVVYILSYPVYSFFLPIYSFWCMDEFSWGNTRVVIGEGKEKKVISNEDEKFDESMIPLKKFSEYEAEAWETGTRHSGETGYDSKPQSRSRQGSRPPSPYNPASQSGDYYRDTNVTHNNSSNPNLRLGNSSNHSHSNLSQRGMPQQSPFGPPQIPFMPLGGGPGSFAGSDFGGGQMAMPPMMTPMGYQNTGSMYGMMGPGSMAQSINMFGGSQHGGSQYGGVGPLMPPLASGLGTRPMSTFSMATSVNPFAGPSMNPNPSDDELFNALRNYLSTQDLMTVTKKTAREAITAKFPKADLAPRKDFLNQSIDKILSES